MKRKTFLAVFIGTNLAFIMLHIHNQSKLIKLSYIKQKIEQEKVELEKEKQRLTHNLQTVHDRAAVKKFAVTALDLQPTKIAQIKKIS